MPTPMPMNYDTDRPWRILLVDDNALDRADAKAALLGGHDRRYQFVEATSANEAMHLCASSAPFDCMLLDFFLPDGDAHDVLARLPCDADKIPHLPVVILTGVAGTESRASLRHGAQDFVGKAWLGRESLTWAVENAIGQKEVEQHAVEWRRTRAQVHRLVRRR
ncbi:MAG: response regulator, partial [Oxalobacteraceae bacterium]